VRVTPAPSHGKFVGQRDNAPRFITGPSNILPQGYGSRPSNEFKPVQTNGQPVSKGRGSLQFQFKIYRPNVIPSPADH